MAVSTVDTRARGRPGNWRQVSWRRAAEAVANNLGLVAAVLVAVCSGGLWGALPAGAQQPARNSEQGRPEHRSPEPSPEPSVPKPIRSAEGAHIIAIEAFLRKDSQQCQRTQEFLTTLQGRRNGIQVRNWDVAEDRAALTRLNDLTRRFGREKASVPSVYVADRLIVGFRDAVTSGREIEGYFDVRAFVRAGCRHCRAAREYLDGVNQHWPALQVRYFDVANNEQARTEFAQLVERYQVRAVSYPCIHVADRLLVGFRGNDDMDRQLTRIFERDASGATEGERKVPPHSRSNEGRQGGSGTNLRPSNANTTIGGASANLGWLQLGDLMRELNYAQLTPTANKEYSPKSDKLSFEEATLTEEATVPQETPVPEAEAAATTEGIPPSAPIVDDESIEVPFFGQLSLRALGLPMFTFLVGLVDGFNPCAMWVLVFLLSVLVNVKQRQKIIIISGTFVVVSALVYFAFMAAWFSVFQLIGLLRPVQIGLGVLAMFIGLVNIKDFFAFRRWFTFSIPDSAKPGIYARVRRIVTAERLFVAWIGAVVLAIVINFIELLCTAGLPAMYTEILSMQKLNVWANYAYLALYIFAYMLDDAVLVACFVATLSHRKLQESEGRWLKLLSGCVILLLGAMMLFFPEWLA